MDARGLVLGGEKRISNSSGNYDPWAVTRDTNSGIGDSAADARYTVGGLAHPSTGGAYGFGDGVFPSYATGSVPGDLLVAPTTPTPSLAATIAAGNAQITRTNNGPYLGASIQTQTVTFAAANATNPRYDLVVLRTMDPGVDTTPTQSWFPVVLEGTPAASPGTPSNLIQDNDLLLARVTIRANSSQVLGSDIVDYRQYVAARGGIVLAAAGDSRGGSYPGQYRDNQATAAIERWNGAAWIPVASGAGWNVFTPPLYYGGDGFRQIPGNVPCGMGAGAIMQGRWMISGKAMHFNYEFLWGSPPYNMGTGNISTVLPPGWTHTPNGGSSLLTCFLGVALGNWTQGVQGGLFAPVFSGVTLINANSNVMWPMFPLGVMAITVNQTTTYADMGMDYYRVATQQGVPAQGCPLLPNGFGQGGSLIIDGTLEVA